MRWLPLLRRETDLIAGELRAGADLTRPVPGCPGWTAQDLVVHVGAIERWVVHAVRAGELSRELPTWPGTDLADWYEEGAWDLLTTLEVDPATPAATFAPDATVGFWHRRQVHEHRVHRWDLQSALGTPEPIEAQLAADGIDEIATMFWPRQVRLGRAVRPAGGLKVVATDTGGEWLFGEHPVATLHGPASDVLLALMHRYRPDHTTITWSGDESVGRSVLSLALAP
jgi:uncharacterized protein (TIGR03083 family)